MTPARLMILEWHDALNAGDLDRLLSLVSDDIEVGGPRGSGRGSALLREWVERAGIQLEPARIFSRDDQVVVEQNATWRSPDSGERGEPQTIASTFLVRDSRVQRVMRYPDLPAALDAAGLDESAEDADDHQRE